MVLEFNFADPLVLQASQSDSEPQQLNTDGLQISILDNELSGIVTIDEINYSDGVGFAYLKLKVDAVEAESLLEPD